MHDFRLVFRIFPASFFGLPDGDRVVIPAVSGGREIVGPTLDTRTGEIASHGTLSEFRKSESALTFQFGTDSIQLNFSDNFLSVLIKALTAQEATNQALVFVGRMCQALSAQHGVRFWFSFISAENSSGTPQQVHSGPISINLFNVTVYNTSELKAKIETACHWADAADTIAEKALQYYEHACLLQEFSHSHSPLSVNSGFSQALAFLQLFKALTAIVGEPGTDKDYQRRSKALGLQSDFWQVKVKPLYLVRCEDDVAHYSHNLPAPGQFLNIFSQASSVFNEALAAHIAVVHEKRGV